MSELLNMLRVATVGEATTIADVVDMVERGFSLRPGEAKVLLAAYREAKAKPVGPIPEEQLAAWELAAAQGDPPPWEADFDRGPATADKPEGLYWTGKFYIGEDGRSWAPSEEEPNTVPNLRKIEAAVAALPVLLKAYREALAKIAAWEAYCAARDAKDTACMAFDRACRQWPPPGGTAEREPSRVAYRDAYCRFKEAERAVGK